MLIFYIKNGAIQNCSSLHGSYIHTQTVLILLPVDEYMSAAVSFDFSASIEKEVECSATYGFCVEILKKLLG